jgi:hypothetical protein
MSTPLTVPQKLTRSPTCSPSASRNWTAPPTPLRVTSSMVTSTWLSVDRTSKQTLP